MIDQVKREIGRRYRQSRDILATEGMHGIASRARTSAAKWIHPAENILEVRRQDVIAADLQHPFEPVVPRVVSGEPVTLNWIVLPPSRGSGGHTTIFRIMNYLEAHGYRNRVYFYNVYRSDDEYYRSTVRNYYGFHGPVASVDDGMEDAHGVIATAWNTAYAVFNARCTGKRFYFVQDFEPSFYPVGSLSLLAENTYRMGLHAITAGAWLAQKMSVDYQMAADAFKFGSDTDRYRNLKGTRHGIVFYARREAARRAFELGMMALELFAERRPDIEIHTYGNKLGTLAFPHHDHGHVTPSRLNEIYNRCYAGLSLSLTNVSLVPHEMLASGCVPVVNEGEQNRLVLDNAFIRYAPLDPHSLVTALEGVIDTPNFAALSEAGAASVHACSWDEAGAEVDGIIRRALSTSVRGREVA